MGLRRFLDVLIKVTLSKATLVLLDEPEFGMHPELQRRFLTFLQTFAAERNIQIFMATHSPVFINASAEFEVFRVSNEHGVRSITRIPTQLRHTMFGDLGVRPSDLFQNDICLMVEGPDDVVFYEYVLHELYREEFAGLAVGVVQYAGDAALGITSGDLRIANVAGAQPYLHWIRDRDAAIGAPPNENAKAFVDALHEAGQSASLLTRRELEFYIPEQAYVQAQNNDVVKEAAVRAIFAGDQSHKFRKAMSASGCYVPRGSELRRLLRTNLTRNNLDHEISNIIEEVLIPWANNLKGN